MFVDDHEKMFGGLPNTVTVRLSPEEAQEVCDRKILIATNEAGNKLRVILMVEDNPHPISSS